MGGAALDPARVSTSTALQSETTLLDRGEFRRVVVSDLGGLHVPVARGDVVKVRQVGHFAVLIHLPYRKGATSVWVATTVNGRLKWGSPTTHATRRLGVLDALKLVRAFEPGGMSGD